ncbi:MAG: phenylacetate--CoA ligase family protein [Bacilli bacterium]
MEAILRTHPLLQKSFSPGAVVANALPYEMGFIGQSISILLKSSQATEIPISTRTTVCPPVRAVEILKKLRPICLVALPVDAECYAQILRDEGTEPSSIGLELILVSSEPSSENRRKRLEETYGCTVLNFYGASEVGPVAVPCSYGSLHFLEDHFYGELNPVTYANRLITKVESTGELVLTTLNNTAMPLVRYCTHDIISIVRDSCPCGNLSPSVVYRFRAGGQLNIGGKVYGPLDIEDVIYEFNVGPWYQVEVTDHGMIVYVESNDDYRSRLERDLADKMTAAFDVPVFVLSRSPGELYAYREIRGRKPMARIINRKTSDAVIWAS